MAQVQFQPSIRFAGEERPRGRTLKAGTRNPPATSKISFGCSYPQVQQRSPKRCHVHYDPDHETQILTAKRCEEGLSFAASKIANRSPTPSPQDRTPPPSQNSNGLKAKITKTSLKIKTNLKVTVPSFLPLTPPTTSPFSPEYSTSSSFLELPPTPDDSTPASPMDSRSRSRHSIVEDSDCNQDDLADESSQGLFKTLSNVLRRFPSNTNILNGIAKSRSNSSTEVSNASRTQLRPDDASMEPLARSSTGNLGKTKFSFTRPAHQRVRSRSLPTGDA